MHMSLPPVSCTIGNNIQNARTQTRRTIGIMYDAPEYTLRDLASSKSTKM